jgi:hypothetical protein
VARLRRSEVPVSRGDEPQVGNRRLDQEFLEILLAVGDEVGEAVARFADSEAGVEVRALQVAVDGDHAAAAARQRHGQVGDDEALANPALAATHRNHVRRRAWFRGQPHARDTCGSRFTRIGDLHPRAVAAELARRISRLCFRRR